MGKAMSRRIIVTGASRGIGRAIAVKLAEEGDEIVVNFLRNEAAANETAELIRGKGAEPILCQANVRHEDDLKKLAAVFDGVDILVHNAAIGALKPYDKIRKNHWDLTLESSLRPFWLLTKLCPLNPKALVIGLSSLGSRRFIPGYAAMGAAKAGLEALTRQLAVELSPRKIRVNTICGGLIRTDALNYFPEGELMISRAEEATPLGRMGLPEDIAGAAWLLTRPEADWMTGQTLVVDGGLSLL